MSNEFDLSKALTVRTFGFNVPCRQFLINAQVSRDRRMPIVDEFILRALFICDRVPAKRLAGFFGFNAGELEVVLRDLQNRNLVIIADEYVQLTVSAKDMFKTSPDGRPTIIETEAFPSRIWYDLISQSMIEWDGLHNVRNLIELKATSSKSDLAEEFARQAFHDNFREYLRRIRHIKNPDEWSLYAVSDVEAGRFSYAQVAGKEELVLDPHPMLVTTLLERGDDRPQRLRLLTDAMSKAFHDVSEPEPSIVSRTDFSRLTDTKTLGSAVRTDGFLELSQWLTSEAARNDPHGQAFVGQSYLDRNRKLLVALLARSEKLKSGTQSYNYDVVWHRPGGTAWGRTADLSEALGDIRAALRRGNKTDVQISTSLVMPPGLSGEKVKRFDRMFEEGVISDSGVLSPAMEVLLIADIGAVISVYVPLSADTSVWIGRMTVDPTLMNKLEGQFGKASIAPRTRAWSRAIANASNNRGETTIS